nr:ABC transporter permease [Acholeplasma laidlawii]
MLVGISGSTALLLAGFGIKDSVELSGDAQFNQMYNFDIELGVLPNETSITLIDTNEKLNLMIQVAYFDETDYINLIVPETYDEMNGFLSFRDTKDKSIEFKSDSVFVTKQFALDHDISVGDFISLEVNDVTSNFTVTGIVAYYFGNNIYISNEIIKDVFDLYLNKIYVKLPNLSKSEMTQLKSSLNDLDNVVHVQTKDDLMASFKQTSSSMNSVIILLVIFASVLSVIINYNLTLINISTRHKEMATLKVLGYDEKEVSGYIFRETFMISSIAILIGLILGRSLQYFIISQINVDGIILKNEIYPLSYLYTAVLSIVYLLIVYVSSIPKIRKIDMLEALKSFE